jgi:SAM-dependent methyltransferase
MPADNEFSDQPGDIWWDEDQPLHVIRTALNPARLSYFASAFAARGIDPAGQLAVDVGCGGGLLAEEMARLGATVIGVDPSRGGAERGLWAAQPELVSPLDQNEELRTFLAGIPLDAATGLAGSSSASTRPRTRSRRGWPARSCTPCSSPSWQSGSRIAGRR